MNTININELKVVQKVYSNFYLVSILLFLLSFTYKLQSSNIFLIFVIYFLDSGHVYSTMIEVYFDPSEVSKKYVWKISFLSLVICLIMSVFLSDFFIKFIFYFTIYHNLTQGLGITFLFEKMKNEFIDIKKYYYFLTYLPFLIFHFREHDVEKDDRLIKFVNLYKYFDSQLLKRILLVLVLTYGITFIYIFYNCLRYSSKKINYSLLYFGFVYAFAFIYSESMIQSFLVLVFSHAVPYFFLMNIRTHKTHSFKIFQKNSILIVSFFFVIGGSVSYFRDISLKEGSPYFLFLRGLFFYPLIAHFIFDSLIWKKNNDKFKKIIIDLED